MRQVPAPEGDIFDKRFVHRQVELRQGALIPASPLNPRLKALEGFQHGNPPVAPFQQVAGAHIRARYIIHRGTAAFRHRVQAAQSQIRNAAAVNLGKADIIRGKGADQEAGLEKPLGYAPRVVHVFSRREGVQVKTNVFALVAEDLVQQGKQPQQETLAHRYHVKGRRNGYSDTRITFGAQPTRANMRGIAHMADDFFDTAPHGGTHARFPV